MSTMLLYSSNYNSTEKLHYSEFGILPFQHVQLLREKGNSVVRTIKIKLAKPKFKTKEELNQFYMTHCFGCRKPLPEDEVRENQQINRDTPEVEFMIFCDNCLRKRKR